MLSGAFYKGLFIPPTVFDQHIFSKMTNNAVVLVKGRRNFGSSAALVNNTLIE